MSIFQKSVVNKYLKNLDELSLNQAYERFNNFYGNKLRLMNIVTLKEENYQEGFLREIFVNVLGYTISPDLDYNLTTEYKNQTDSKKADGAILKEGQAIGVIELKSTKTAFIESITNQAFNYKHNQPNCRYVITSNFHHLRFFIDNSTEFEEFDLFELTEKEFARFYLFLSKDSIFSDIPVKLKEETKFHEENITDKFYRDYKQFKDKVFENLVSNNPVYDKLILFKKSQKLLDRFIFVWFAEDCGLVAPNTIQKIIDQYYQYIKLDDYKTLFSRFQLLFHYLDKGYKSKTNKDVYWPPYNGGLFKFDDILDNTETKLDDNILLEFCPKISTYDFSTELDVNILGHIFEHSLNEIEEITAELKGEKIEKTKTKRKKEGVFYTPKYITIYIIENTIGALCKEKKQTLKIQEIETIELYRINNKITKLGKELFENLQTYKKWLFDLKILDPACGSGAFLNQALDYLINEHKQIDELIAELTDEENVIFDIDKSILEKNIFGVDINDESVEIAKLSLWLRTAKKDRPLSDLNENIKCGNSLIDNIEIASEKAFDWKTEFPEIMEKGGFDVIIGNPPYVFTRENISEAEKNYYITNYFTNQYQANLYILFVEKSFALLKPKCNFGFIIPNAWLMVASSAKLREFLLKNITIFQIVNFLGETFQNANVEPIIITAKKEYKTDYLIDICNNLLEEFLVAHQINSNVFAKNPNFEFTVFLDKESEKIIKKIKDKSIELNEVTNIKAGLKAYEKGKGTPPQTPYHLMRRPFDFKYKYDKNTHKYLEGKDVCRYAIKWSGNFLQYTEQLAAPRTFDVFSGNKIIVREIAGKYPKSVLAVYSEDLYLFNMSNIAILEKAQSKYSLKYILALLNSQLMSFYFLKNTAKAVRNLFPKIILNDLRKFPIKELSTDEQKTFADLVDKIQTANDELNKISEGFTNYLKAKYEMTSFSEKLQKWYELNSSNFLKELGKVKIKLHPKDEVALLNYYNEQKKIASDLLNTADMINNEIDSLVFKVYELDTSEIEIIKNAENNKN